MGHIAPDWRPPHLIAMTSTHIASRDALPDHMRILLRDYPREAWPDHPNFARSIENWMGAHSMFRQLGELCKTETERFLDGNRDVPDYAARLGHYGHLLVANLHGHHTWEDRSYFPELLAADPRFGEGLEMLEGDHVELDGVLDGFTRSANSVIQLAQLDPGQVKDHAADVHAASETIEGFLERHLADEEDLVVPILLHHKMRG